MINDIFGGLSEESKTYHKIKQVSNNQDKILARLLFTYYLCDQIKEYYENYLCGEFTKQALLYFIVKEDNLSNHIAVINNTYQMAVMMDRTQLLMMLVGQTSNMLVLGSEAAKLGALLALRYKISGVGKLETLRETLLLAESMV